ncbi:MAG TPA: hypothetical protein PKJ99_05575 [Thermoanaerobaculales bacterium]|nr:hypothetical protein [Thermoanaerobaculales bacterium]HPA82282.1 hypothetical protein [Thermoanaerobaculales bacterium]HQL28903.1 hypothetical protein [Thermoanaerobaculales bacterium]HQN96395.1 hypothetical protein [Thermoanaerobaculales bacterium]HQP44989.1 hypothetical protein [Thermoanaerobaculales bacterium]
MSALTEDDAVFVDQRRGLARRWRYVGWALLAAIVGVVGFLFLTSPLLVAPWEVAGRIRTDSIPPTTLQVMGLMLPLAILGCFVLLVVVVAFQFAAAANERRLLQIIDSLLGRGGGG